MISLRSKVTQAVLGFFMLHEQSEMYVNELARRLSLDSGNLTRKLKELEREGIVHSRPAGTALYYSLNPAFPLFKEYKQIILKTTGFEHALRESLQGVPGIKEAYLFGSYAKDSMDASSDIDLLVVGKHDTVVLQKTISHLQKSTDREVNVRSFGTQEYNKKRKSDPLLRSIFQEKLVRLL